MCAVLLTQACNIGWVPVVKPALARDRLTRVAHNDIRAETLAAANAALVAYHGQLPLVHFWGSADGSKLKYFGMGRAVTHYNFVSDQFSGFHALVVPGTLRDSLVCSRGSSNAPAVCIRPKS